MLDQLFRQEALDAYAERWLGEASSWQGMRPVSLAVTGSGALAGLLSILFLGVYAREVALEGVITGPEIEVTLTDSHAQLLRAGATVAIDRKGPDGIPERFRGQISSIIPSGEGGESSYRIRLTAPSSIRSGEGESLLVRIPVERRRIYQWMVSWSPD